MPHLFQGRAFELCGGTWSIKGKVGSRMSGQYMIGLKPGNHTIQFGEVSSKTKPNEKTVTVKAGEVKVETAAYT